MFKIIIILDICNDYHTEEKSEKDENIPPSSVDGSFYANLGALGSVITITMFILYMLDRLRERKKRAMEAK